jgi:hypothetical protein
MANGGDVEGRGANYEEPHSGGQMVEDKWWRDKKLSSK